MKVTVISFFILFFLPIVSGIEISFISPESVYVNETFTVSIDSNSQELRDVKIFILDSNKKIISEIYNGSWENPFYYIKDSFPEKKVYEIKIFKEETNANICLRLRASRSSFDEKCNKILIKMKEAEEPQADAEIKNNTNIPSKINTERTNKLTTSRGKLQSSLIYIFLSFLFTVILIILIRRI